MKRHAVLRNGARFRFHDGHEVSIRRLTSILGIWLVIELADGSYYWRRNLFKIGALVEPEPSP